MENIFKIIYDKSISNKILDLNDLKKILELLIDNKNLNNYILNINVETIRSNNLASYSPNKKIITIYKNNIKLMIQNIKDNIINDNNLEILLYINLSILQILLHEVEHANQHKILNDEKDLEAIIIELSTLVPNRYDNELLYKMCPEERLAEINSYYEIVQMINFINSKKLTNLPDILKTEKSIRLLRGYHYIKSSTNIPIIDYFTLGNEKEYLPICKYLINHNIESTLNERCKYGFPISTNEYKTSMRKLVISLNKNFNNRIICYN